MAIESYWVDKDPRPKTHPCAKCARDVVAGERCICIPSTPQGERPTIRVHHRQKVVKIKRN